MGRSGGKPSAGQKKTGCLMNFEPLEKIANAVLYEGFLLYPYRKSSIKNQKRWHFGTLGPEGGVEASMIQSQCLVEGGDSIVVDIRIRFLQDETEREVNLPAVMLSATSSRHAFQFPPIEVVAEI